MRVTTIHDDEREEIVTYVSTYDFQEQLIKASKVQMKYSNQRLQYKHTSSYHKNNINADFPEFITTSCGVATRHFDASLVISSMIVVVRGGWYVV